MTFPTVSTIINGTGQTYLGDVITGVQSVLTEFIPYLIYIALGVLVATLWFVAVKWLMNWTSKRVTAVFSSRRKRR